MQESKVCTKCKEFKLKKEFSRNAQGKDGLRPSCKACDKAYRDNRKQGKNMSYYERIVSKVRGLFK